ncbi:YecA family protein [Aliarcobacter butzleri]|uniref:YecA family protein n=1 Tax=Aliarcobacter butzleri TaxID=28197 RepID=UPI003AF5E5C3
MNNQNKKIGRNDICPCGSGKKYKYCHIAQNLTLQNIPINNIYNINNDGLNIMNIFFHNLAQVNIPIFEFCLDNDIYYFSFFSMQDHLDILNNMDNNTLTVEELFKKWIIYGTREYFDRMLKNSIHVNSILSKRKKEVNQLLDAHFQNMYFASIPLAFSIIEGLFRDYNQTSFDENKNPIYKIDFEIFKDTMLYKEETDLKYFTKFLNKLMSGKANSDMFHRHSVLHGANNKYANEKNSLLLIMTIFKFFNLESHNKYYPIKESYTKDGITYINGYQVEMRDSI